MQTRRTAPELGWDHLRFALAARRAGSLAGAARALGVDETTVSRRIDALEREAGEPLFVRARGALQPTDRGLEVANVAVAIEEQVLALGRSIASGGSSRRRVRLAMTEVTAITLVREGDALRARVPDVEIDLRIGNAVTELGREADVALRLVKPKGAGLRARKIGRIAFALYASHGYLARARGEVRSSALAGHDVVLASGEIGKSPEGRWMHDAARGARVIVTTSSLLVIAEALAAGLGVGVLPRHVGDAIPALARIEDLDVPMREAWVVLHEDLRKSAAVRLVAEAVEAIFRPRLLP